MQKLQNYEGVNMQKEKVKISLIATAFLIMTCCIFVPSSLFLGNVDEFRIDYIDILPVIICMCILGLAVCVCFYFFWSVWIYL